jgi:copper homeostasis protein CutC
VDEGVIPTLVREVLSAGPRTDVSQAVDAIMVLCETPQHRSAVIACGGVEALAAMVMRREFGQPGQQSAAYTLSRLAADAEQVRQIDDQ